MNSNTTFVAQLIQAIARVYGRKWSFLSVFAASFVASVSVLAQYDLLPGTSVTANVPKTVLVASAVAGATQNAISRVEEPIKIEIEKISLLASIANPATTDIENLDNELLKGAVRFPTSAKLGEQGNIVLFGHSSYLPIVGNQAYKTFNGIQKLVAGDVITVYSSSTAYTYRVRTMERETVGSDAGIPLEVDGRVLTLATCNSFGTKSDRFVVTADFVESHSASI